MKIINLQSVPTWNNSCKGWLLLSIAIFSCVTSLKAWNKVWESTGTNEEGTCRSPIICRNLSNDGLVTASYWYCTNLTSTNKFGMKFLETDDVGDSIEYANLCASKVVAQMGVGVI